MRMPVSFSTDTHTHQIWVQMKKHGNRSQIMRSMLHGWASIHEKELTVASKHLMPVQVWVCEGLIEPRCNPFSKTGRCSTCWPIAEHFKLKNVQNEHTGKWTWAYFGGEEE